MKILTFNPISKKLRHIMPAALGLLFSLLAYHAIAQTATNWWDNNGASAATSGNWDTNTASWSLSSALTASTVPFTNNNYAIFAAGSGGILNMTITVPGAVSCQGFGDATTSTGVASGAAISNLTFSGVGSINLPSGTWPIECGNSSPAPVLTVSVPITGPGGIIQHNSGTLNLYGTNTYSGGTTITGGQITQYNNNSSFGTGAITFTATQSLLNTAAGAALVTLTNAFIINSPTAIVNFGQGNTTCTGPWTLNTSTAIKNNALITSNLTLSGVISGAFGINFQAGNGSKITLSGANTYTGATIIGTPGTSPQPVSVTTINSVTTPAQQSSSSLGVPSSVATGTIGLGSTTATGQLTYTGSGETSDRVINLSGTTGGGIIEMDGAGPLIFTSPCTATGVGAKVFTLQGTSTATNTIMGAIVNSSSGATIVNKEQAGTWMLAGANTYTGGTTNGAGTLIVNSIADSGTSAIGISGTLTMGTVATSTGESLNYTGASAATTARSVVLNGSTTTLAVFNLGGQTLTLSGVVSGAGTPEVTNGTLIVTGTDTYSGRTQVDVGGTFEVGGAGKLGSGNYNHTCVLNGTWIYASSAAQTNTGNFTGSGSFIQQGTGVVTLSATSTLTGPVTIGPGSTILVSTNNAVPDYFPSANYAGNFTNNGTFNFGISNAETISGPMTGTGNVTVNGAGPLTLGAAAYTGATTIAAGSQLIFSAGASPFPGLTSLSIGAGGSLDVSACGTPYAFNNSSYTFTSATGTPASIKGASSGVINLGSAPMSLTFAPTSFSGDSANPALNLPQSSLTLSGNVITVNNAGGTPLNQGNYTLIQVGGGTTTGTPSQFVAVTGSGIAAGLYATVQVIGGNVVLVVTQPPNPYPTWTGNDYANLHTWSDAGNWLSGLPDASGGDSLIFDNTGGPQTPVMDGSYTVFSLTFAGGCSPDILAASSTNILTVGSGVMNASGNSQTIAMPVQLVDLGSLTVPSQWSTSGGDITASGVISDNNVGLAVSGGGTLTLTGSNTYTGGTTINGATLSVNSVTDAPGPIGTGALTFTNSGLFSFTGASSATARTVNVQGSTTDTINVPSNSVLSLNGQVHSVSDTAPQMLTLTGGGTLNLGGTVDNSGLTMAINTGEVVITKTTTATVHGLGGGTTTVGTGTGGNSAELQLAGSGGFDLFNSCAITVNGIDGFVDLNGQNDSFGVLTLSGAGPSGNGVLINSSGTASAITNTGGVALVGATTIGGPGNIKLASPVTGSGMALTYASTGILTLGGAGTYSGGTTVNSGGTLQVTAGGTTTGGAGTGIITLLGNSTLIVNMGNTELPNTVTGGSSNTIFLTMAVAGNLWLTNTPASQFANFTGTFNVSSAVTNGGQLVVGTASLFEVINPAATWQLNAGAVIDFNVGQTDPATVYLYGAPYTGATLGSLRLDASVQSGPVILMGNSQIGSGSATGPSTVSSAISDVAPGYGFAKMGANPLVLTGTNTYAGFTTIAIGPLTIGGSGSLGSGSYAASITNSGTFIYNSSVNQTLSGIMSGTGAVTQQGPGSLTLSGADTYFGATTISAGTLALSGTGSISNTTSINIAMGATFDVSGLTATSFFLSSSNALIASGAGTSPGSTAATIKGATTVNLGSQPIRLTFTPTSFNGDTTHPALYVSQGSLALNGNVITVTNAGGAPLDIGTYTLINVAGGSITGATPTAIVTGSGLTAGNAASIVISGGNVNLVVGTPTPPVISNVTSVNGSLVVSGSNGVAGGTFYVLTSSNLTTPDVNTTNWTIISTNTFSPTGTFSFTNPIGTNVSSFFSIKEVP